MSNRNIYIHPSALVETDKIGDCTRIWAFSHILKGASLGRNCNICDHCFIENDVVLGNDVTVKCGVNIWDGVRVEDKVFIGSGAAFTNDIYPRSKIYQKNHVCTLIKEGASLGTNCVLIAGITVGSYAMIGAGSVVTRDVGDFSLCYGNPARQHGYICKCKKKIDIRDDENVTCACGLMFTLKRGKILMT
jgi:acetyltransferase-like isoleucine patch superfamily enzyme